MGDKNFITKKDAVNVFGLTVFLYALVSAAASVFLLIFGKEEAGAGNWVFQLLIQLCFLGAGLGYVRLKKINVRQVNGLNKSPQAVSAVLLALLPLALILFVYPVGNWFMELIVKWGYEPRPDTVDFSTMGGWGLSAWIVLICILPALGEELIFRGIVLEGYREKKIDFSAIAVSAVLFTLIHMNVEQTVHPLLMGAVLGFVYCATGSLWNTVLMHLFNNLYALLLSVIPAAGTFVDNNWWLMFPGFAAACAILAYIWKKRDKAGFSAIPEKSGGSYEQLLLIPAAGFCAAVWILGLF